MRRLIFSAYLFAALPLLGCSDKKDPGGVSDEPDDESPSNGKTDAGKDAGKKDAGGKGVDPNESIKVDAGPQGTGIKLDPKSLRLQQGRDRRVRLVGTRTSTTSRRAARRAPPRCSTRTTGPSFPAGLTPPTIMWEGTSDGSYLKLAYDKLDTLEYETAAGPQRPGRADDRPSRLERDRASHAAARDLLVTLSTKSGSTVSTCNFKWTIAQGAMTGSVFYNTYNSPDSVGQGAVMRLTLGQPESEIYLKYRGHRRPATGPCMSCHSVSANGAIARGVAPQLRARSVVVPGRPATPSRRDASRSR